MTDHLGKEERRMEHKEGEDRAYGIQNGMARRIASNGGCEEHGNQPRGAQSKGVDAAPQCPSGMRPSQSQVPSGPIWSDPVPRSFHWKRAPSPFWCGWHRHQPQQRGPISTRCGVVGHPPAKPTCPRVGPRASFAIWGVGGATPNTPATTSSRKS